MNIFYVYTFPYHMYGKRKPPVTAYVRVTKSLKIQKALNIDNASTWVNKKDCLTWQNAISKRFPKATISICKLNLQVKK